MHPLFSNRFLIISPDPHPLPLPSTPSTPLSSADEVVWFFRTSGRPAPNKAKGRINEADFADPNIFELIWLVQKVVETITTYREVIARYFATYLSTTDVAALGEVFWGLLCVWLVWWW